MLIAKWLLAGFPYAASILVTILCLMVPAAGATGAVALVVAAVIVALLRIDPLELIIITMPIAVYAQFGAVVVNTAVSDVFLAVLILKVLLDRASRATAAKLINPLTSIGLVVVFLLVAVSIAPVLRSFSGSAVSWSEFFLDGVKICVVAIYFMTTLIAMTTKMVAQDFRFMRIWSYTAAVISSLGVVGSTLYKQGIDVGFTWSYRASGTFEDPNSFATYLVGSIGVVIASTFVEKGRILSWLLIPILAGIYLSESRAGYIATAILVITSVVFTFRSPFYKALRRIVVGFAIAASTAVAFGYFSLFDSQNRDLSIEGDIRFQLWSDAISLWQQSPVWGVGLGQFRVASFGAADSASNLVHNTYLSFLAEGGLLGLTLFLALPGIVIVALFKDRGTVPLAFLISMTGLLVMNASLNLQNFRPFWVFLALALAWMYSRNEIETRPEEKPRIGRSQVHEAYR